MGSFEKPSYKIYCKTDPNFLLSIRSGKVILAPSNPCDLTQYWYKETIKCIKVQDKEGVSCYALVNKSSGEVIRSSAQDQPVTLVPYNKEVLDLSVMWSDISTSNDGYKSIRMGGYLNLCFDAQRADKRVEDGTNIVLWTKNPNNNQLWRMELCQPTFRLFCKDYTNLSLTIRDGKVVLAPANSEDIYQHWHKDDRYGSEVKDIYNNPGFFLINKVTGQVIKRADGDNHGNKLPLQLAPYDRDVVDKSVLWGRHPTNNNDGIRSCLAKEQKEERLFSAKDGKAEDGVEIISTGWRGGDDQWWRIKAY